MWLSRVRVEDVDVLVKEQLDKLGRLQVLPLAAQQAGSLLRRVQHAAARQRENHQEGVLHRHGDQQGLVPKRQSDLNQVRDTDLQLKQIYSRSQKHKKPLNVCFLSLIKQKT